jgi:probable phosphoglycerate mutase
VSVPERPPALLYLIRHGQAAAGVVDLDPGLDALGHRQAAATAKALRPLAPLRLVVSPLRRTQETAAPIAAALGLTPELREEVAEVFPPEMASGERRSMIGPFMRGTWGAQPDELRAWRDRALATLRELAGGPVPAVVVSHYIAIGVAIGAALGDDRVVPAPIANASITTVAIDTAGRLAVVALADTRHLPADAVTGAGEALLGRRESEA